MGSPSSDEVAVEPALGSNGNSSPPGTSTPSSGVTHGKPKVVDGTLPSNSDKSNTAPTGEIEQGMATKGDILFIRDSLISPEMVHPWNEDALEEIAESKYEPSLYNGGTFLPQFWDMLVQPGWRVKIQLLFQRFPEKMEAWPKDDEGYDENLETSYENRVNYTVSYYQKSELSNLDSRLLRKKSYDESVIFGSPKGNHGKVPVPEETKTIIIPSRSRPPDNLLDDENRKPKLRADDRIGETHLQIYTPFLLNLLRSIIKYSSEPPSGDTDSFKFGVFKYPFRDLYFHKNDPLEYKQDITNARTKHSKGYNAQCDSHIDVLINYLYSQPAIRLKELEDQQAKNVPTTTFAGFWHLMKPGTNVYVRENSTLNPFVIDRIDGGVSYEQAGGVSTAVRYLITVWNLIFDGKLIRRVSKKVEVPVFDDELEITSLPLFPTRFEDDVDGGELRQRLVEQGRKYFTCCKGPAFLEYTNSGRRPFWRSFPLPHTHIYWLQTPWR